jgi:predicted dehydrogenase
MTAPAAPAPQPFTGPVGVGFIGVGVISDTYLENLNSFPDVEVLILGDLDTERAAAQASKHAVPASGTAQDVLDHPGVQVVVNLTIPAVHAEISSAAIAAGKHVWTEKPLGLDRDSTSALLALAADAGLRVGCAPDTVLGAGVQTAKRAVLDGLIGRPLFAQTSMQWQGPEVFHPNPGFLFAKGAGPLLDMGPYYFTTLVNMFGTVEKVAALGLKASEEREIRVGDKAGTTFPVEVPSTISVLTQFEGGQTGTSVLSFDSRSEHVRGSYRLCASLRDLRRTPAGAGMDRDPAGRSGHGSRPGPAGHGARHPRGTEAHRERRGGIPRVGRDALRRGFRRAG